MVYQYFYTFFRKKLTSAFRILTWISIGYQIPWGSFSQKKNPNPPPPPKKKPKKTQFYLKKCSWTKWWTVKKMNQNILRWTMVGNIEICKPTLNLCYAEWIKLPPSSDCQPIRLLDPGFDTNSRTWWQKPYRSRSFVLWRSQLIWIYTVCKGRA